ncbi:hypothetical protein [Verticiella alkaliphila]|nr:hypothetical protein [Verticiella sp. GG226]
MVGEIGEDAIPELRTAREDAFTALKAIITVVLGPDAKDTDA